MPRLRGSKSYCMIVDSSHPLAMNNGRVAVHRLNLYEKIGPGEHPCHWCGRVVEWQAKGSRQSRNQRTLISDHVDGKSTNNHPDNLVPSCHGCNVLRVRGCRVRNGGITFVKPNGETARGVMLKCHECGSEVVREASKKALFCSKKCGAVHRAKGTPSTQKTVLCMNCGASRIIDRSRPDKFCSRECATAYRFGPARILTEVA